MASSFASFINPLNADAFVWSKHTPFSHIAWPVGGGLFYLTMVKLLQHYMKGGFSCYSTLICSDLTRVNRLQIERRGMSRSPPGSTTCSSSSSPLSSVLVSGSRYLRLRLCFRLDDAERYFVLQVVRTFVHWSIQTENMLAAKAGVSHASLAAACVPNVFVCTWLTASSRSLRPSPGKRYGEHIFCATGGAVVQFELS